MPLNPTRGSALVTRSIGARGGQRLNIFKEDVELASTPNLLLWLDGESVKAPGASIALADRVSGRAATAENGVALALGGSGRDDLAFRWPAVADNSRIIVPDFSVPSSYWAMAIVKPLDGFNTTRALLHGIGVSSVESWLTQAATGEALDFRVRHAGAGGLVLSKVVPHTARSLLWWGYDAVRDRFVAGIGRTLLGQRQGSDSPHTPITPTFIGGRAGTGTPTQHQVGDLEMFMIGEGAIYSTDPNRAANGTREDLISMISDRYGLNLPAA